MVTRRAKTLGLGRLAGAGAALLFLIIAMATIGAAGLSLSGAAACEAAPTAGGISGLPARAQSFAPLYVGAAQEYGLGARGPAILASIHQTESGFGANEGPSAAGAVGQMQFLPSTWERYGVDADGDGRADPASPVDAIYSAANDLRASRAPGDWYTAIFAYNHASWYVAEILAGARRFGDVGAIAEAQCESTSAAGPANLAEAVRMYGPQGFRQLPAELVAPGFGLVKVETRVYSDAVWLLRRYDLRATAGAESGHKTHGDGTAIDAIPSGSQALTHWRQTAERAARDLGWTPGCARSGVAGVCPHVPAIQGVFYNGYPRHGDPAHSDIPHVHVSWKSSSYGTSQCCVSPAWIEVFPAPAAGDGR